MEATILDLRRHMPAVLRALDRHERVTILHRGRARAVLTPVTGPDVADLTSHPAFGLWADRTELADVQAHVRQLRRPRHAL